MNDDTIPQKIVRRKLANVVHLFKRSSVEDQEVFIEKYDDIAYQVASDPLIMLEVIEDMVNLGRLTVHEGNVFYRNKRIL